MVALDGSGRSLERDAFNDVRVQSTLGQILDRTQFSRFLFKDMDKFPADDLPLFFRIRHTFQTIQEMFRTIHQVQINAVITLKHLHHFSGFPFSQKTIVHQNTRQIIPNGFMKEHRGYRGIHPAGKPTDNPFIPQLCTQGLHRSADKRGHIPGRCATADVKQEIGQDFGSFGRMGHLRMELHAEKTPRGINHGRHGAVFAAGKGFKSFGHPFDTIPMTHPDGPPIILFKSMKQVLVIPDGHGGISVFPITRLGHHAAPQMGKELHAVTDAQYRDTEIENTLIRKRRIRIVDAGRTPG